MRGPRAGGSGDGAASTAGHGDTSRDNAWVFHGEYRGEGGPRRFVRARDAGFGLQDRGVTFGDGVYEVVRYDGGRAFAADRHVARMRRSLAAIELDGVDPQGLEEVSTRLLELNGWSDALAYWQVTRGCQPRDFVIAGAGRPTVTVWLSPSAAVTSDTPLAWGAAVFAEDLRWLRCDIKSLLLLPASLARTRAAAAGAVEAILVREKPAGGSGGGSTDGGPIRHVTEGTSTNVIAVVGGALVTHPSGRYILSGVTREVILERARRSGREVREQPLTPDALRAADEVLVCSTTQVTAITSIDGQPIGEGVAGPVTRELHAAYLGMVLGKRE